MRRALRIRLRPGRSGRAARTVLVIGPLPPPVHGASRVTEAVLDGLRRCAAAKDVRVRAVSTAGIGPRGSPTYHLTRLVSHLRGLVVFLDARIAGPTTVYIGGAGGAGLWYQAVIVGCARLLRAAVMFHHHSFEYLHGPPRLIVRGLTLAGGARTTHVCLSAGMAERFRSVYQPSGPVLVASNARFAEPVEHPGTDEQAEVCSGRRLIHVSNLSVAKGTLAVIETFERLRARFDDVTLTLVGHTIDVEVTEAIDAAARRHGPAFHYVGPASREEVDHALRSADLFLFPSHYRHEAQPLVVLEALALGVPVLATPRGTVPELLPVDWLIEVESPLDEQADAILVQDRAVLGARARSLFAASRASGTDVCDLL